MSLLQFAVNGNQLQLVDRSELVKKLNGLLQNYPDLQKALKAFNVDPALGLDSFIAGYEKKLRDIIPDQYLFLLDTLDHFQNKKVSLFELQKSVGGAPGPASLSIKADSELTCDLITADQLKDISLLELGDQDALVKLGLAGDIGFDIKANPSVGLLKYGIAFGASTDQSLGYYLKFKKTDRAIEVFSNLQDSIAAPTDLAGLCTAMKNSRLTRFERHGGNATTLAVSIGVSRDLAGLFGAASVVGGAKLDLKVEYKDKADQILFLERIAGGKFSLGLEKTRFLQQSSSLKFGLDIKILGFKDKVTNLINRLLPGQVGTDLTEAINRLDAISKDLQPNKLVSKLEKQLQDALESNWDEKGKPALAALLSETDLQNAGDKIRQEIQDRLLGIIDERIDKWNDSADSAAAKVATLLTDELELGGSLGKQLHEYLSTSLAGPLQNLKTRIDAEVTAHLTSLTNAAVNDLLTPWRFLDQEANALVAKLTSSPVKLVNEAKQLLQKIYGRYNTFRQSLLDGVKNNLEDTCTLTILSQKSRNTSTSISLRAEFDEATDELEQLYAALWYADLTALTSIATDLKSKGISLEGEYADTIKEANRVQLSLDLFGLKLTQETLFSSTVQVKISPTGNLLVAASEADFAATRSKSGESLAIEAHLKLNYLTSSINPPLILKMTLDDDEFKPGEIADFLAPLEANQLVRAGFVGIIKEQLFPKQTVTPIAKVKLAINTLLKWDDWLQLMDASETTPDAISQRYLAIFQQVAPTQWGWVLDLLKGAGVTKDKFVPYLAYLGSMTTTDARHEYSGGDFRGFGPSNFSTLHQLGCALHALRQGVKTLQDLWLKIGKLLPAKTASMSENSKAQLEACMLDINSAFQMIFDGVTDTGLILDDPGTTRYNHITISTLKLLLGYSNLPNHYLSCTFVSQTNGKLNFS